LQMDILQIAHAKRLWKDYLAASKDISAHNGRNRALVLARMLLCRIKYCHGPLYYNLYCFDSKKPSEWKEFLTKNEMLLIQSRLNSPQADALATDKLRFYERCISRGIRTPPLLAVVAKDSEYPVPAGVPILRNEVELRRFFQEHNDQQLIFKDIKGAYGEGLLWVRISKGDPYDHNGVLISSGSILSHCFRFSSNFLVQERLRPHEHLRAIMPGAAIGTIRIITFLDPAGSTRLFDSLLKIPIMGNPTDNFHQGKSGNLLAGIDTETGRLLRVMGMKKDIPLVIDRHPSTGTVFKDMKIPCWTDILAFVCMAGKEFPELKTAGWDIGLCDTGIYVLEANARYDIDGHQMVADRGMRRDIVEILNSLSVGRVAGISTPLSN
jgi:hypothetical protein